MMNLSNEIKENKYFHWSEFNRLGLFAKRFVNKEKVEFPDFDGSHYKQAIERLNGDYVEKCGKVVYFSYIFVLSLSDSILLTPHSDVTSHRLFISFIDIGTVIRKDYE